MLKEHLFDLRPERPGYRLHRLEVYNWGTFDSTSGHVYRFEPEGRTSLLVGCNGFRVQLAAKAAPLFDASDASKNPDRYNRW